MKSSIRSTKRDRSNSTNSKEAKMDAASLMSNSSTNMVTTATTTNRGTGITTRIDLASTYSEDQREASTSKSTHWTLQENQRHFASNVYGSFSHAEWDSPFGNNDLGEDLHQIFWTMSLELDDQQLSGNDIGFRYGEEGPTLAAGFTLSAQHLRQRIDCLLHGITCEKSDQEISRECVRKHCSIMKASMVHMSSCSEFTSCSNVICLLFSPLLLHWKSCCGPCSICGPTNVKYNKKKLLSKISSEVVAHETQENVALQEHGEIDAWRRQGIIRATPYYLRKYMMEDQPSVPEASNGYKVHVVPGKKLQGIAFLSTGITWDQLPGIDCVLGRLLEKQRKPDSVNNSVSIGSYESKTSSPLYSDNNDKNQSSIQDLLYAIGLYNHQVLGPNNAGKMQSTVWPWKTL